VHRFILSGCLYGEKRYLVESLVKRESRSGAFTTKVYQVVAQCPRGKVVSYGGVAAMAGKPRAARAVGAVLRDLPDGSAVPWWRVVNSNGMISERPDHGPAIQRKLLRCEGVRFDRRGRMDWEKYGWSGR
jgi:methylated-DNA-protein-cysteine methyltransferase-like protein